MMKTEKVSFAGEVTDEPTAHNLDSNSLPEKQTAAVLATVEETRVKNQKKYDNMHLMFVLPFKLVAINRDYNKPETFESDIERRQWHTNARREAFKLKVGLQLREIQLDAVGDRVVVQPVMTEINYDEQNRFTQEMREIREVVQNEKRLVELSEELQRTLTPTHTDVDECLRIFTDYKTIKFTRVMLIRRPECVNTINRLRCYVGSQKYPRMSVKEEGIFKRKAECIRSEATAIYNKFKTLFNLPRSIQFWDAFSSEVEIFKANTKNLNPKEVTILSEETYLYIKARVNGEEPIKMEI